MVYISELRLEKGTLIKGFLSSLRYRDAQNNNFQATA